MITMNTTATLDLSAADVVLLIDALNTTRYDCNRMLGNTLSSETQNDLRARVKRLEALTDRLRAARS